MFKGALRHRISLAPGILLEPSKSFFLSFIYALYLSRRLGVITFLHNIHGRQGQILYSCAQHEEESRK